MPVGPVTEAPRPRTGTLRVLGRGAALHRSPDAAPVERWAEPQEEASAMQPRSLHRAGQEGLEHRGLAGRREVKASGRSRPQRRREETTQAQGR